MLIVCHDPEPMQVSPTGSCLELVHSLKSWHKRHPANPLTSLEVGKVVEQRVFRRQQRDGLSQLFVEPASAMHSWSAPELSSSCDSMLGPCALHNAHVSICRLWLERVKL